LIRSICQAEKRSFAHVSIAKTLIATLAAEVCDGYSARMVDDTLRAFLEARRGALLAEIEPLHAEIERLRGRLVALEAELSDVDKARAAIGMVNGLQEGVDKTRRRQRPSVTIKDAVIRVLVENPPGLTALDILEAINSQFGLGVERTSLSPQLSRLKVDERIKRLGKIWSIRTANEPQTQEAGAANEKGSGAEAPEPFQSNAGDVAERLNAPDSKSGGAGPQKSSPVGSNPTVSAPFARKLMVGAALPSSPSNLQTSLFGKKGG
jgi:uncharacterized protein (UPF0218 family)